MAIIYAQASSYLHAAQSRKRRDACLKILSICIYLFEDGHLVHVSVIGVSSSCKKEVGFVDRITLEALVPSFVVAHLDQEGKKEARVGSMSCGSTKDVSNATCINDVYRMNVISLNCKKLMLRTETLQQVALTCA